jgi:hypothetical protein
MITRGGIRPAVRKRSYQPREQRAVEDWTRDDLLRRDIQLATEAAPPIRTGPLCRPALPGVRAMSMMLSRAAVGSSFDQATPSPIR